MTDGNIWSEFIGQSAQEILGSEPLPSAPQQSEKEETNVQQSSRPEISRAAEGGPKPAPLKAKGAAPAQNLDRAVHPGRTALAEPSIAPSAPTPRPKNIEKAERFSEPRDAARTSSEVVFESTARDLRQAEIPAQTPSPAKEFGKENTDMASKWLDTAFKRQKQEAPNGNSNGTHAPDHRAPLDMAAKASLRSDDGVNGRPRQQGDLPPMEDIYRAAGIMTPRMGYSITKVVEMINSDYMRGLSERRETRRAADGRARCRRDFER